MKKTKISKLKKGDFFRFVGKKKVYIYDGKVRMYSKWGEYRGYGYSYIDADDISGFKETFTNRDVEIGFDY